MTCTNSHQIGFLQCPLYSNQNETTKDLHEDLLVNESMRRETAGLLTSFPSEEYEKKRAPAPGLGWGPHCPRLL